LCELCLDAVNAVMAVESFEAAVVDPNIKFSTWLFVNSGNVNTCEKCDEYSGDTYELEDPDDLLDIFPFGVWVDEDTFACNVHLNCVCYVVRQSDYKKT
jgi:hypothetical protein